MTNQPLHDLLGEVQTKGISAARMERLEALFNEAIKQALADKIYDSHDFKEAVKKALGSGLRG
jgi:hypothetical protein